MFRLKSVQDCHNISNIRKDGRSFHLKSEIIFKDEITEVLNSDHNVICCCNLVTSGSRSETLAKIQNVVLEKEGKEHLDR